MEAELRHKLFPPNAWMKVLHFNVLTSCPKDELHQWFIRLYGEHIILAIVHRYTKILQRPDCFLDGNITSTPGCGTLAGPSLKSAGFRSLKPKGYAGSPGPERPVALQKPGRPGRVLLTRYDEHIPGIYLSYVPTQ
jgi:hypothetical protein